MTNMFNFKSLAHINIVVDNIQEASHYYEMLLGAIPQQEFPRFQNSGFSKSAGFMDNPDEVITTIRFLLIPGTSVIIEMMQYHYPKPEWHSWTKKTNQIGGVGHIALSVDDIDKAFTHITNMPETKVINESERYGPYQISPISDTEFYFFDKIKNADDCERKKVINSVQNIRYFYFIDKYNIQWEFVSGMDF